MSRTFKRPRPADRATLPAALWLAAIMSIAGAAIGFVSYLILHFYPNRFGYDFQPSRIEATIRWIADWRMIIAILTGAAIGAVWALLIAIYDILRRARS